MDKASHAPQQTEDGCELFGRYVASEVRAISNPQLQRWAKLQIQTVLFNALTDPPNFQPHNTMVGRYPHFPLSRQPSISPTSSMADHSTHSYWTPINCACCFSYLKNISVHVFIMCNYYACAICFFHLQILITKSSYDSEACFWNNFANCLFKLLASSQEVQLRSLSLSWRYSLPHNCILISYFRCNNTDKLLESSCIHAHKILVASSV